MSDNSAADHTALPRFEFPDGELDSWAVLGDVTDSSVRVWARAPHSGAEARLTMDGAVVAEAPIATDGGRDHVGAAVLRVDPPCPDTNFQVTVGEITRSGRFAPAPGSRAAFTFAFGSCHQPFTAGKDDGQLELHAGASIYPRVRDLLLERNAAFAMWLGDQVYSDAVSETSVRERLAKDTAVTDDVLVDTYRHLYRGYFNEKGYRELAEALPAYLMWDDHDIYDGWGSLMDRTEFDERVYRAAEYAFVEYQQLRNPRGSLDAQPPFGYSFWRGDVGFHVPDLRGERDFERRQVMGPAGWKKLDDFFAEATDREVPTVFLGLSVPLIHASPSLMAALERLRTSSGRDVRDRWSVPTFALQRTMLLERTFEWQAAEKKRQVVVLSGDVHVGAAFEVRSRYGQGRFAPWTSSALSTPDGLKHILANRLITKFVRVGEHEVGVIRKGLATSNNVGLVDVEPAEGGGHVVRLTVYEYKSDAGIVRPGLTDVSEPGQR